MIARRAGFDSGIFSLRAKLQAALTFVSLVRS